VQGGIRKKDGVGVRMVAFRGKVQVLTPGKNHRRTIYGAVDLATGRWCYLIARKAVRAGFTQLLALLLAYQMDQSQ
jgi:hypothetical protein